MISARLKPNVWVSDGGRVASRAATSEVPMAPASVSMCPASASSASERAAKAVATSRTRKPTMSPRAMPRERRSASADNPWSWPWAAGRDSVIGAAVLTDAEAVEQQVGELVGERGIERLAGDHPVDQRADDRVEQQVGVGVGLDLAIGDRTGHPFGQLHAYTVLQSVGHLAAAFGIVEIGEQPRHGDASLGTGVGRQRAGDQPAQVALEAGGAGHELAVVA